jgi:hypothetical protein
MARRLLFTRVEITYGQEREFVGPDALIAAAKV